MARGDLMRRELGGQPSLLDPLRRFRELFSFDPFAEMDRLMPGGGRELAFSPAFDVKETKDAYEFRADLPGVKEQDVDITLTGNRLTISGKRDQEEEQQTDTYYAYERAYGTFSRSFTLPEGVDAEHIRTEMKNGVLLLAVPKKPEVQPKKIAVQSGAQKAGAPKA